MLKMLKDPKFSFLTHKITLSYLILGVIAVIAVFIISDGIRNILHVDESAYNPNKKLYLTNKILTQIYDAESEARSYYLFRNKKDLENYVNKVDHIRDGIDTLTLLSLKNQGQIRTLHKINELLDEQKKNIAELIKSDSKHQKDELYNRALEEVYIQAYDITPSSKVIKQNVTTKHDSIFKKADKDNFFKKVKNLFSSTDPNQEQISKVVVEQHITYDTLIQPKPLPDSVVKLVKHTLDRLKQRDNYLKEKIISNETQLLQSNRILMDNLREMVSSLEREEIANSTASINKSKAIIQKTTLSVLRLGFIAIFLIAVFIIIIYRDIKRNIAYNKALKQAQQSAHDLVNLKEQFLTNMSHEIRTPLSSIIGFSEQLTHTTLNPIQETYLSTIQKSSGHLLNLVNDLLDLSKINGQKLTLEHIRFNISELIYEIYQNFNLAAHKKNIELLCSVDPSLKTDVLGDPLRLRQVLINLVGNAIKFTDYGSIEISGTAKEKPHDLLEITISISDTGIGISPEKQELIFDEFSQADTSVTRKYGGTGLGLSIASKIIKLHRGTINLSSSPGKGSTFTIHFSLEKAIKKVDLKPLASVFIDHESLKKIRILIVDDDETLILLIKTILTNGEIACETANNGNEALSYIRENHFDLVFTDIHMPDMSGFDLLKKIKAIHKDTTPPPMVALTAHASDSGEYSKAGFAGHLSKPFTEADFINKLISVIWPDSVTPVSQDKPVVNNAVSNIADYQNYSLSGILEFTGTDSNSLHKIIQSFVSSNLKTIEALKKLNCESDMEVIANHAHKMLPLFKQFQINEIASNLSRIERYKELNLGGQLLSTLCKETISASETVIHKIARENISSPEKHSPAVNQ